MKIALFAALTLAAVSVLQAGPVDPPSLPLDKAAAIAQKKLEELKLPSKCFLRTVSYYPSSKREPVARYHAYFEPLGRSAKEPIKIKYIVILMDGTATVEEREFGASKPMAGATNSESNP